MNYEQELTAITDQIAADVSRLNVGEDAHLDTAQLANLLDQATRLAAAAEAEGIGQLTDEEAQRAAAVAGLWERQLARMTPVELRRETYHRRESADRIGLHLIAMIAQDPEIVALARQSFTDWRKLVSQARDAGANWRRLAGLTPEQRRAQAELHARLDAKRDEPPAAPDPAVQAEFEKLRAAYSGLGL